MISEPVTVSGACPSTATSASTPASCAHSCLSARQRRWRPTHSACGPASLRHVDAPSPDGRCPFPGEGRLCSSASSSPCGSAPPPSARRRPAVRRICSPPAESSWWWRFSAAVRAALRQSGKNSRRRPSPRYSASTTGCSASSACSTTGAATSPAATSSACSTLRQPLPRPCGCAVMACAMHCTVSSRTTGESHERRMLQKGRSASSWCVKCASSARTSSLLTSCRRLSTAYMATLRSWWHVAPTTCGVSAAQMRAHTSRMRPRLWCAHSTSFCSMYTRALSSSSSWLTAHIARTNTTTDSPSILALPANTRSTSALPSPSAHATWRAPGPCPTTPGRLGDAYALVPFRICQSTERGVPMVPIGEELPSLSDSTFCADPPVPRIQPSIRPKVEELPADGAEGLRPRGSLAPRADTW
mmetsp:Transcript_15861/g.39598  ORF Transcript_15861/g.39598 Transcript_15861/m.39598 type:complete len:416 (+) Transcript_15861:1546-2793(+)